MGLLTETTVQQLFPRGSQNTYNNQSDTVPSVSRFSEGGNALRPGKGISTC